MPSCGATCGLKVKLESDSPEKKFDFDAKDKKALASIMLCIKASQINNVKNCVTAASAWETLKEIHMPAGPARRVHLLRQLLYIKLTDSENMASHIAKFSDLIQKLSEIEFTLADECLCILLLSSLPESFDNFVVAIESRDSLPTLATLKIKLLKESESRNMDREHSGSQKMFSSRGEKSTVSQNKNLKQRVCWSCGRQGHIAANCKSSKKPNEKRNN